MDRDGKDPGELLDKALETMDITFPAGFDPKTYQPRHGPRATAWKVAVAAGVLLLAGAAAHDRWTQVAGGARHLAAPSAHVERAMMATPAGLPLYLGSGQATWSIVVRHPAGGSRTLVVSAVHDGRAALSTGFSGGHPVWVKRLGESPIPLQVHVGSPLSGSWVPGSDSALDSLAAAGNYTYVTNGAHWAVMGAPGVASTWQTVPDPTAGWSWIQALPGAPATAVLLTQDPGGQQGLFWRDRLTGGWSAEALPGSPVTELVAAGSRFWALAGGRLVVSRDGHTWRALFSPPAGFAATTFAIDPVGSGEIAVALAPNGGAGVGPVMLSQNDGVTWTTLPPAWPTSGRPMSLVLDAGGDVSALFGPPGPVTLERWDAATGRWSVLPLPAGVSVTRPGLLGALSQGDLVYADPAGQVYVWSLPRGRWHVLPRAPQAVGSPTLLMGIGTHQVLVAYPHVWAIFVAN
jgi:hypothetical protein